MSPLGVWSPFLDVHQPLLNAELVSAAVNCWSRLSTMVCHNWDYVFGVAPWRFLNFVNVVYTTFLRTVLSHQSTRRLISQLHFSPPSIWSRRHRFLVPWRHPKTNPDHQCRFSFSSSQNCLLFAELDKVPSRLEQVEQGSSSVVSRVLKTSNTSGGESDMSQPRRRVRSKRTFKKNNVCVYVCVWGGGGGEVGRFSVTGPKDDGAKPSHFNCRVCCKVVSVLIDGIHEVLRPFQGTKHFAGEQRLRLETTSWYVLDYGSNSQSPAELELQRDRIVRAPLVVWDSEYPFSEDVIVDESGAVDPNLAVMAEVSSLIKVLRLGRS